MKNATNDITILIVEDDPTQLNLVAKQVQSSLSQFAPFLDVKIKKSTTLKETQDILLKEKVDCILLDLTLQDSVGISTVETIRYLHAFVPIVVMTADDSLITSQLAIQQKAQDVLIKGDYSLSLLCRSILNAIQKSALEEALEFNKNLYKQSESKFRNLLESLPVGVIVLSEDKEVKYINQEAEYILYTDGTNLDVEAISALSQGRLNDLVLPLKDNKIQYLQASMEQGEWQGEKVQFICLSDSTEKRKLEEQINGSERMQALGTLAGGIAHDLNNLLSPIMLGVQALVRNNTDEKNIKILSMIEQSTHRSAELVKHVLNFSRGESFALEPTSIVKTIDECVQLAKQTENSNVSYNVITNSDEFILCVSSQLKQVFTNVISNAAYSIESEGEVTITIERVTINKSKVIQNRFVKEGDFSKISISDTGSGISESNLSRIFEPFFTTKPDGLGTGLGLYTVHNLVKRFNGWIEVESEIGKGSTFSIYFPRLELSSNPESGPLPSNVAIIDSSNSSATLHESFLVSHNVKAEYFADFNLFLSHNHSVLPFDVVFIDSSIRGATVQDAVAKSRQLGIKGIIFTTGLTNESILNKSLIESVDFVLKKPFTKHELLESLKIIFISKGNNERI